jgi:lipopolysaccharide biosynthesis glycosyltransferase
MNAPLKVYIGYDSRETEAYAVAVDSLLSHASAPVSVTALNIRQLSHNRLMRRPVCMKDGRMWDIVSGAAQSTEFAISRFLTPLLAQEGMALFVDCDIVFMRDIYDLIREVRSEAKAVHVVKHQYRPVSSEKMDGQAQVEYPRKNWSSVMLFDCDHPSTRRLNVDLINTLPGRDLHRFCWLRDEEIGELDPGWNWLVGEQDRPSYLGIAHFTLGGPWLPNWKERAHDDIWIKAKQSETMQPMRQGTKLPATKGYS